MAAVAVARQAPTGRQLGMQGKASSAQRQLGNPASLSGVSCQLRMAVMASAPATLNELLCTEHGNGEPHWGGLLPGVYGGALVIGAVKENPNQPADDMSGYCPEGTPVSIKPQPSVLREWAATSMGFLDAGGHAGRWTGGWFCTRSVRPSVSRRPGKNTFGLCASGCGPTWLLFARAGPTQVYIEWRTEQNRRAGGGKVERFFYKAGDEGKFDMLYDESELAWSPRAFRQLVKDQIKACLVVVSSVMEEASGPAAYSLMAHVLAKEAALASNKLLYLFFTQCGGPLDKFMQAGRTLLQPPGSVSAFGAVRSRLQLQTFARSVARIVQDVLLKYVQKAHQKNTHPNKVPLEIQWSEKFKRESIKVRNVTGKRNNKDGGKVTGGKTCKDTGKPNGPKVSKATLKTKGKQG